MSSSREFEKIRERFAKSSKEAPERASLGTPVDGRTGVVTPYGVGIRPWVRRGALGAVPGIDPSPAGVTARKLH